MNKNREYKNDVFCMLMEYPEKALDVYNALRGTNYTDASIVEIMTIRKGISLSVRNDAAFVINTEINMYEHQSTYCPNMPLRSLIYFATTVENILTKKDIYGRKQVEIPTPHFVVFYNGEEKRPEKEILKLSDAFTKKDEDIELELKVTVYNINSGNNEGIVKKSRVLDDYMIFVDKVRRKKKEIAVLPMDDDEMTTEYGRIVEEAVDECIEEGVMADFLKERKGEVIKVMALDYTFERREELIKEEYLQEGIELGIKQGITQGSDLKLVSQITKKLAKGKDIATIAEEVEEDIEKVKQLIEENNL